MQIVLLLILALAAAPGSAADQVIGWVEKAHIPAVGVTVKSNDWIPAR
ncbi:MAG: hypothetical protein U5K56_20740 [Halioglobus sp.]|nr:hypothetical protein [Halioglobus sp.]